MRLIDAVALKKKAQMRGHVSKKEMVTVYQMCVSTHDIDEAPTVDAEPVRNGRWIYKYFDSYCSVCGWENKADTVTRIRNDYPYCPNCGAKMDKEEESCATCAYGGRPSYKSPCSECANMSKYEKEVE